MGRVTQHTTLTLQDVVHQRGLASTQEAGDDCDWHLGLLVAHPGVCCEEEAAVAVAEIPAASAT